MRLVVPLVLALLTPSCGECFPVPACEGLEGRSPTDPYEGMASGPFDWAGSGTVVSVGPSQLTVDFDGTERTVSLPARPQLEAGQSVEVADGVISADGRPVAVVRRAGQVSGGPAGGELSLGSVTAEQVPTCKLPSDSCGSDFLVVYALDVDDVRVEPGEAATVVSSDGRQATLANRRVDEFLSCGGNQCLIGEFGLTDVALVFHD